MSDRLSYAAALRLHYQQVRRRLAGGKRWDTPRIDLIWWTPKIKELHNTAMPIRPLHNILMDVCQHYAVSVEDMLGYKRSATLNEARQEFHYRAMCETVDSLVSIGRKCRRDHGTVLMGAAAYAHRHGLKMPRKSKYDFERRRNNCRKNALNSLQRRRAKERLERAGQCWVDYWQVVR